MMKVPIRKLNPNRCSAIGRSPMIVLPDIGNREDPDDREKRPENLDGPSHRKLKPDFGEFPFSGYPVFMNQPEGEAGDQETESSVWARQPDGP